MFGFRYVTFGAAAALLLGTQAPAQVDRVDPDGAAQSAPMPEQENVYAPPPPASDYQPVDAGSQDPNTLPPPASESGMGPVPAPAAPAQVDANGKLVPPKDTFAKNELIAGAEGVFGKGAKGLAEMIESILRDQGEPNAYIAGQEAGGALVVGVRYGSGKMRHRIEGDRPVFWTGPTVGFDAGGDANKVFVLVYNLHDTEDLFRSFPSAEGHAYFIGGMTASMLRRGDIVLIPIRLGVGMRLGVNAGYMRFSKKNRWLPL